jgi:alpha-mannosidase
VDIKLTLIKGQKWIDVNCFVDNKSSDHRLRILLDTHTSTDFSSSLIPFDVTERDRREAEKKICGDGTQPNSGFVYVSENGHGTGIMNEGLYEYEHLLGDKGTIAVTLLRCAGIISNGNSRVKRNMMQTFESQCIGKYELHLGITFENGEKQSAIASMCRKTKNFQNGIISHFQPYSEKKFTGGRPQVQVSDIAELFFRPDKYENICLDKSGKLFEVIGDSMTVTAMKQSEDGKMLVIRAFNTSDETTGFEVKMGVDVKKAYNIAMNEKYVLGSLDVENGGVKMNVKPHGIVTLGFEI